MPHALSSQLRKTVVFFPSSAPQNYEEEHEQSQECPVPPLSTRFRTASLLRACLTLSKSQNENVPNSRRSRPTRDVLPRPSLLVLVSQPKRLSSLFQSMWSSPSQALPFPSSASRLATSTRYLARSISSSSSVGSLPFLRLNAFTLTPFLSTSDEKKRAGRAQRKGVVCVAPVCMSVSLSLFPP